ncbi:MAG TPA: tRNA (adenosine(37)-N6)-threonylcarbamoyltransferase complex ATPase subunit type 1 TsaE [Syntrophales bacterium]|nr:tRNA (adenosine(37)-N6)-threonylcarbamoyltransferase complex ATPase subunit type 1 TsaE [Syntrophales bacterium]
MSEGNSHLTVISENPEETFFIGRIIGENLNVSDVVALIGELGAGKTRLTQGIARGIGVPERFQITSPSFTLINEYPGRVTLYHFDLYRLAGPRDVEVMGYEEYFFGEGVSVIEWADKIKYILPEKTLFISFKYLDENKREIVISGDKQKVMKISDALKSGGL